MKDSRNAQIVQKRERANRLSLPPNLLRATTFTMVLIVLAVLGVLVVLAIALASVCVTGACALVPCTCNTSSTTRVSSYGAIVPCTCIANPIARVSSYSTIVTCQSTRALKLIDQSGYCLPTRKIPTLSGWPSSVTVNYWILSVNDIFSIQNSLT